MSPLSRQVGGTHYVGMKIQPLTFAMTNHWDAAAFSILKYLSRFDKPTGKGKQDLEKSAHFVELRIETLRPWNKPAASVFDRISMAEYCHANGIDWVALYHLDLWVNAFHDPHRGNLMRSIQERLALYAD